MSGFDRQMNASMFNIMEEEESPAVIKDQGDDEGEGNLTLKIVKKQQAKYMSLVNNVTSRILDRQSNTERRRKHSI